MTPSPHPAEAQEREAVARAIWNSLRETEDRLDMELEDMGDEHPVWGYADAAIAARASHAPAAASGGAVQVDRNGQPVRNLAKANPAAGAEPDGLIALAELFHDTYERLAPSYGYETRDDTKAFSQHSKNGRLMIATLRALRKHIAPAPSERDAEDAADIVAWLLSQLSDGWSLTRRLYNDPPNITDSVAAGAWIETVRQHLHRLAKGAKPTQLLLEHSGCGNNTQVDQLTVRLNPGDKVVLFKGPITAAIDAQREQSEKRNKEHGA